MDPTRFDGLAKALALPGSRRSLLRGLVGGVLGALGLRTAGAQVSQVDCGNQFCASNPGGCLPGCVCCVYTNSITGTVINSRCRPPGTCSPGTQVGGTPTTTTAAPTTTTTAPTTTTVAPTTTTQQPTTTTASPTTTTATPTTTAAPTTTTTQAPTTTTTTTTAVPTTTTTTTTQAPTTTTTTTSTTAAPTTTTQQPTTTTTTDHRIPNDHAPPRLRPPNDHGAPTTTTTTTAAHDHHHDHGPPRRPRRPPRRRPCAWRTGTPAWLGDCRAAPPIARVARTSRGTGTSSVGSPPPRDTDRERSGRGSPGLLNPANHRVLAFVREDDGERVLVATRSRFCQALALDLGRRRGQTPVGLFGRVPS